jgi:hypothetical protein
MRFDNHYLLACPVADDTMVLRDMANLESFPLIARFAVMARKATDC